MTRRRPLHRLVRGLAFAAALASVTSAADVVIPAGRHVEIRGSLAMGTVARAVAEEYMTEHPDTVVTVSGGGTYRGIKSVIVGTADMAMGIDVVPAELAKLASSRHETLESHAVFSDAVVVLVNPENPIAGLSMQNLRDVFRGSITHWSDLGVTFADRTAPHAPLPDAGAHRADAATPPEEPDIDVVTFARNMSPYETFKKEVLGEESVVTPRAREVDFHTIQTAIGGRSIGYTSMHQVGKWKVLPIGGVVASTETVRAGHYPIARKLFLWTQKPTSPAAESLLEYFLAKDKGQRISESLGNVPVR